jgi:hypothetical protein
MEQTLRTEPPIRLTPKTTSGCLRVPPAPILDVQCPKCAAFNLEDRRVHVWAVSDERGLHYECDCCSHAWVT